MTRPKLNAMPHIEAQREIARRAREALRAPLQDIPPCDACGLVGAGMFGFGDISDGRPGARYACADPLCRASVATMVMNAEAMPAEPAVEPVAGDLFPSHQRGKRRAA